MGRFKNWFGFRRAITWLGFRRATAVPGEHFVLVDEQVGTEHVLRRDIKVRQGRRLEMSCLEQAKLDEVPSHWVRRELVDRTAVYLDPAFELIEVVERADAARPAAGVSLHSEYLVGERAFVRTLVVPRKVAKGHWADEWSDAVEHVEVHHDHDVPATVPSMTRTTVAVTA